MKLTFEQIQSLAEHLEQCERQARDTPKITDDYPQMSWQDAYAIQEAIAARKIQQGHRITGLKAGLTSHAKMQQMGVDTPIFGWLADYFAVPDNGECLFDELIHPKVEPEIAFVLKRPLKGPGCHIGSVLAATDFVVPAIEIIDSRYRDFRFDLKSVVADNCSSARYIVGSQARSVEDLDLRTLGIVLEKNGEAVALGAGAAVLSHPAAAVAQLANHLGRRGQEIPAGQVILSGGVTEAISVSKGDVVTLKAQHLGSVTLRFV